jgi:hypothetical protein
MASPPTIDSWKPTLCLDFDGVIHLYSRGWQNGEIYDEVVPGFFEWALEAKNYFSLTIYSSRSSSHKTRQPMEDWLQVQLQGWIWDYEKEHGILPDLIFKDFTFIPYKPAAFLTIDDRAITFKGNWNIPELNPETLSKFKPWNS